MSRCFGLYPVKPRSNNVLTKLGEVILNVMWTVRHKTLANGQSKNKCLIVSSRSQKLHLVGHVQLRLIKLSFVKITCLWTNHINTLIFKGTLTAQTYLEVGIACELITSIYIDLTVNTPELVNFQCNISGW